MNTDFFFNPAAPSDAPVAGEQPEQSLEAEVQQVIGQFGKFWGGVRKQSASAFDLAKKDITQVVDQARTELSKLGAEASQRISVELNRSSSATSTTAEPVATSSGESTGSASTPTATDASTSTSTSQTSFFDRIQSSLPPNIARHIPPAGSSLAALRADLTTQFTNIQHTIKSDLTQAERIAQEYSRKSEALLKEAGEFLKEAVKVLPPDDQTSGEGLIWDGSDVWTIGRGRANSSAGDGADRSVTPQQQDSSRPDVRVPTTRAEALLAQLRRTPGVLRVDPASEERSSAEWETWSAEQWNADWQSKIDFENQPELTETKDILVPNEMEEETFWKRYSFRVYQIERDEERRKALLSKAAAQKEEDFSWDDEEEGSSAAAATNRAAAAAPVDTVTPRASTSFDSPPVQTRVIALSSGATSPRVSSSDDSYDVVGEDSAAGGTDSSIPPKKAGRDSKGKTEKDDSEDSDWE